MEGLQPHLRPGPATLEVVGESQYQDALWQIVGGRRHSYVHSMVDCAWLVPEDGNPYDPNAIAVWVGQRKVGYLTRDRAVVVKPKLVSLMAAHGPVALTGTIVGGQDTMHTLGMLGIFLDYDPADFGEPSMPQRDRDPGALRTGLSEALATDAADDHYDLGWTATLSPDRAARIPQLRELLSTETAPVSRHYLFEALTEDLYKMRSLLDTALEDFDLVCIEHDAEMDTIRPAVMEKFGGVPLIEMYRQAAVRQHKAGDLAKAMWWAERGLLIYGEEGLRPDAVEDLRARADKYRAAAFPGRRPSAPHTA